MTPPLRPALVETTRTYLGRTLAIGAGCALLIALAAHPWRTRTRVVTIVTPPRVVETKIAVPVPVPVPVVAPVPAPVERSPADVHLVFTAGGATYMKLADLAAESSDGEDDGAPMPREPMPHHGKARLIRGEDVTSAVAPVADGDAPLAVRDWKDRRVRVDGSCEARVTGFAVVARLVGDIGYAGSEDATDWSASNVMSEGSVVLAARLDGCTGTFARDAALTPVAVPTAVEDPSLAAAARDEFLRSSLAKVAQQDWLDGGHHGKWSDEEGSVSVTVLRHPRTGMEWVSVHGAVDEGCGGTAIDIWGLYRVSSEGELQEMRLRALDDITVLDRLVDIDGDGEPELVGRGWLGLDQVIERANGAVLARLSLPYFGCPC